MSAAPPAIETRQPGPVPALLVELPSWREVFFRNLRDLVSPPPQTPLELRSAPAAFWPDVFVKRPLPWEGFVRSGACHLVAFGLLLGLSRFIALQPRVVAQPVFEHSDVIYYQPSEYLPPLDTRSASAAAPKKADPVFSRQPIISVPAEADNHSQTIVTPPKIKLNRDLRLPNIVAWSDAKKPRLDIPAPPLTLAAQISRIAPKMESAVVAPAPNAGRLEHNRNAPILQSSVVAPPPDLRAANDSAFQQLQPSAIAPPPELTASTRRIGDLNIGASPVIAPAPQLPTAEQRTLAGGRSGNGSLAAQAVAPPPSLASGAASGASFGARGRMIALSLNPAVGAPPNPPAGNRRGSFAATPEGHAGASGVPASSGSNSGPGSGSGSAKANSSLPSGLYVGKTAEKTSSVAGEPGSKSSGNAVNPNLIASVHPPRVSSAPPRIMQPDSNAKLSEAERSVFGNRRFYSVSLNMPNLNSGGGSWVIRFAELNHDTSNRDPNAPPQDLSQPMATRKVDPAYPTQLMRENVAGTVILYAVIHADGSVGNVRILRGVDDRLDRYASEAVAQWKFDPATKNGTPVDVEATFQIPFKPTRVGSSF
ncbi:MAG TPA: TonB family protein [Candidatus Sulfotelmatobacter sp.]|jgi:TonB family protein